jgi:hypothetical protein
MNRWRLFGVSLGLIAAFYLLREHWGHALGVAPYLLLLACPLLHLFHHHGGHRDPVRTHDDTRTN